MIVHTDKSFRKDLQNLKSNGLLNARLNDVLNRIASAKSLSSIPNVKHISGEYYRIRIGDYRLGFRLVDDELILQKLMHRKEIYRHFPPK